MISPQASNHYHPPPKIHALICIISGNIQDMHVVSLYCAMPRDYLSDTPLLRAMPAVCSVSIWPIGCDTSSSLSVHSPPGEHAKWKCDNPPPPCHKRDISAIHARYHMKTRQNGCDTALCDTISQKHCEIWGVSRTGPLGICSYS